MDIQDLLKAAPGLLESIQKAGVPSNKIGDLSDAIGSQLGGDDGLDLSDLLGGLDLPSFLSKIDVDAVASQIGLSPSIVKQAIALIGPKVAEFVPGGLGGLGALAGKLFK